jgi:hypothetical protein
MLLRKGDWVVVFSVADIVVTYYLSTKKAATRTTSSIKPTNHLKKSIVSNLKNRIVKTNGCIKKAFMKLILTGFGNLSGMPFYLPARVLFFPWVERFKSTNLGTKKKPTNKIVGFNH